MNDLRLALLVIGGLILAGIYLYGQWEARRKSFDPERGYTPAPMGDRSGAEPQELPENSTDKRRLGQALPGETPAETIQQEEFSKDLDSLATLVEEDKDHHPLKAERTEAMTTKKVKKSRFFSTHWMKKKPDSAPPPEAAPSAAPASGGEPAGPELILILTVVARGRNWFRGRDIVQVLEERNLQYGEMNIYHAYSPAGRPIFSVANMVEPGTFDLEKIDNFTTPGLTLFLRLPGPAGGFAAFDAMLDTARLLAEKLHGEIRDERRNVLTAQALAQTRERILTFNRARRSLGV